MKTAYVALAIRNREKLNPVVEAIKQVLNFYDIEPIIFADRYAFSSSDHVKMMELALLTLEQADFLIAEVSEQAIGVGIEVGYAAAKSKPIVYIRHNSTEFSTTVGGVATHSLIYETVTELRTKLSHTIDQMVKNKIGTS